MKKLMILAFLISSLALAEEGGQLLTPAAPASPTKHTAIIVRKSKKHNKKAKKHAHKAGKKHGKHHEAATPVAAEPVSPAPPAATQPEAH